MRMIASENQSLQPFERKHYADHQFSRDTDGDDFVHSVFTRVSAKQRKLCNVDFSFSVFDACYFRDCIFKKCKFTGCRFVNTNFHGSSFDGCKFEYATFDKTDITCDILKNNCPGWVNLKRHFARSLRKNYESIGDKGAADKAFATELKATEEHLRKAWKSNESYYRTNFKWLARANAFFQWVGFWFTDIVFGNGQKVSRPIVAMGIALVAIAILHLFKSGSLSSPNTYLGAFFVQSPSVFFGICQPASYSASLLTMIYVVRLVVFGSFMTLIVRQFSRR